MIFLCFLHHNIHFRYFAHKHVREIANTKTGLACYFIGVMKHVSVPSNETFYNLTLPQKARVTKMNIAHVARTQCGKIDSMIKYS